MSINELIVFLGWSSVINIAILATSSILLVAFKSSIISLHSKLLGVDQSELPKLYFSYLGNYKIAIVMLNLTPYIALKVMS